MRLYRELARKNGYPLAVGALQMTTESGGAPSQPWEIGWVNMGVMPVGDYLRSVGDELPIYRQTGLAPPLYATAAALGILLKALQLPPGAIHSLQEVDVSGPVAVGRDLRVVATLERPRQRSGLKFITAAYALFNVSGKPGNSPETPALSGKSAVMVADAADAPSEREPRQRTPATPGDLPVVARAITQKSLTAYAAASGDDNPLHLDAGFAAGTRFGGIIAHGMLTLAFISEMMTAHLGERWLIGGSLRARFKGAAYLDDRVETWGRAAKASEELSRFNVGLRNSSTGEELITGTASVKNI